MWTWVIGIAIVWVILIVLANKFKGMNSAAIFTAEYKAARDNNRNHSDALFDALKMMRRLTFYR